RQKPPGVGSPARASAARLAAFGPTRSTSAAAALLRDMTNCASLMILRGRCPLEVRNHKMWSRLLAFRCTRSANPPRTWGRAHLFPTTGLGWLFHMIAVARDRIDHGDLLHREVRHDLDLVLLDDQHLLDAHTVAVALAVLGLEREGHAFLDLDRMVERPDARDDRRVVLGKAEPVAPQVG